MTTRFDEQFLYTITDLAAITANGRLPMVYLHLDKGYIPCDHPCRLQGVANMFSQENLLAAAVFYELSLGGMANKPAAKILGRLPAGTWQDVRDGFTRYAVVQLSGEGGIQLLSDVEELLAPPNPATLVIDLVAIRENVIRRVEDTYDKRRKNQGMK